MEIGNPYHYRGNPAQQINGFTSLNSIPAALHRSDIHIAPTVTSFPRDSSMAAAPYILNTPNGEFAVMRTSSNIIATPLADYQRHGYFSQVDDVANFKGWLSAGTKSKPVMFEEVAASDRFSRSGVILSFGEKQSSFMHGDTYLRKYVHDIHVENARIRDIGKAFSRIANVKQALMDYYKTEHARDLVDFLASKGYSSEDIGYLAVGFMGEHDMYGVTRANDGRVIFMANENAYEKLARFGKRLGLSIEQAMQFALDEEETHIFRGIGKEKNILLEELLAKGDDHEFYERMASESKGEKRGHYKKMAAAKVWDIETTPERYKHATNRSENLESLADSWKAEARSMKIDETEYVSAKMATHPIYGKGKDYGDEKPTYKTASRYAKGKGKEARGRDKRKKGDENAETPNAKAAEKDAGEAQEQRGENPEQGEQSQGEASAQ